MSERTVERLEVVHVTSDGGCGRACSDPKCKPKYTVKVLGIEREIPIDADTAKDLLKRLDPPFHPLDDCYRGCCVRSPRSPVFLRLVLDL